MFHEYVDLRRADWPAAGLAAMLTHLQESGYQGLLYDAHQLLRRYTQSHSDWDLAAAVGHLEPAADVLIPPAQPHTRIILYRPDPGLLRVVVVGRTPHEARISTTAVKMHLEAALGGRLNDLIADENGRASLQRFRHDVLPSLHLVGETKPAFEFRTAAAAQLLMALRHQPVFRNKPTVLGSQVAALAPDRAAEPTRDALDQLAGDGVIERWQIAVCRESSQWLAVASGADEIKAFLASNVACPHCGRRVSDEQVDVAYRLGEDAQAYLVDNRWICDLTERALRKMGVEAVTVQPGAGPVDGAACYHGAVLVFKATDTVGAEAIAALRAQVERLAADGWRVFPFMISSQPGPTRPKDSPLVLVEGLAALEPALDGVLRSAREADLRVLLPPVLRPIAVALADLIPAPA